MQNLSSENEFDSHVNEPVGRTHFHINGFAQRLFLTQRCMITGNSLLISKILS